MNGILRLTRRKFGEFLGCTYKCMLFISLILGYDKDRNNVVKGWCYVYYKIFDMDARECHS